MKTLLNLPPSDLRSDKIFDVAAFLRTLDSVRDMVPLKYHEAFKDTRDFFNQMARRFPDGVAPKALPEEEASDLIAAAFLTFVIEQAAAKAAIGRN